MRKIFLLFIAFISANAAIAASKIVVSNVWVRPAPVGKSTAVYMDISNQEVGKDVELIEVESSVALVHELHKTVLENNVSRMVHINKLLIPANTVVTLAPKAIHIMLMKLTQNLSVGDTINLLLVFSDGTKVTLKDVPVKNER